MKKNAKWIVIAVVLVAIIVVASALYSNLSEEYAVGLSTQETEGSGAEGTDGADKENDAYEMPDFTVVDGEGNEVRLSDFRGKPVVLNFWTTWCYYCKVEMPDFNEAYKKYPDVQFMMLNATDGTKETVSIAKEFIADAGYEFDVFFDTERNAVNTYGVYSYPYTFFIDKDGNLVTYRSGMLSGEMLEQGISMIREEKK